MPFYYGYRVRGSLSSRHGRYLYVVFLDSGPHVNGPISVLHQRLETAFNGFLSTRPNIVRLLEVRWSYDNIGNVIDRLTVV